ncbi:hypothetical protein JYB62_07995 [Algoriphagus lutimaris]|uniref:hypothetical protein n=1 Tax=Algoriphagus lutimaris TaxID=613197 RepID=UPI00196B0BFB|nr:hypothetical protein [Algoriphagus lutimaris]MBN3519942.1 hypothetical protein [Algoriphagus lutimaris]
MRKLGIALILLIILSIAGTYFLENWLSKRIPKILNEQQDRDYDLLFEEINIHLLQSKVDLQGIRLVPLNDSVNTKVSGSLREISMSGMDLLKVIFDRKLEINELKIVEPSFRLIQKKNKKGTAQESSMALQLLFQDIISRGEIKDIILENGNAEFFRDVDSLVRVGQFTDLNLEIKDLQSDSALIKKDIPFTLESLVANLKNIEYLVNPDQLIRVKEMTYNSQENSVIFNGIGFTYNSGLLDALSQTEFQKDLIEFEVKELKLSHIDTKSSIYGDLSLIAGLVTIDSLDLIDLRDKNKPRPSEPVKPMFEGLIEKIPFPLRLDTIRIQNSIISYQEIGEGNSEPANLSFENVSAELYNVLTTDSLQQGKTMKLNSRAKLRGHADVEMDIQVPYGNDVFKLNATISGFNLPVINELFAKMGKFRVDSGILLGLRLTMDAQKYSSRNTLAFDYRELKLEMIPDDDSKKGLNTLINSAANLFTSKENIPNSKNYKTASYNTSRNVYRGPFNLIWESSKEGLIEIVPVGIARTIIGGRKK